MKKKISKMYINNLESDCVNNQALFSYLEQEGKDPSIICREVGIPRNKLTKPGYMISMEIGNKIMDISMDLLEEKDPKIFYYIGRNATKLNKSNIITRILLKLGNPEAAIKFLHRINEKFNNVYDMRTYNVNKNSGILIVHYRKLKTLDHIWKFYQEYWNEGLIAGISLLWDLPYIETDLCISRFNIEDVFKIYKYMNHNFYKERDKYYVDGEELAKEVILQTEKVDVSYDFLDFKRIRGELKKTKILTNKNPVSINKNLKFDRLNKAVLITRDFQIGKLGVLKKGQIFNADYTRINLKWENKKINSLWEKLQDLIQSKKTNKIIINRIEEELTENKEKAYQIKKLYEDLIQQTEREKRLELNMTGGFAHEIRNALAGTQLRLKSVFNRYDSKTSSLEDVKKDLNNIVKIIEAWGKKFQIDENDFKSIAINLQNILRINNKIKEAFGGINYDVNRALEITGEIREYAKTSQQKIGNNKIDVSIFINSILKNYKDELNKLNIKCSFFPMKDSIVFAKETHLNSIVTNIINNSIDAFGEMSDNDKKEIKIIVKKQFIKNNTIYSIIFEDNGPGMPADIVNKIFDPFFTTKPNKGTGLGMGFVKKIVELYHGDIQVESRPECGTVIDVSFPEEQ